jgi:hypothetical protein
VTTAEVRIVVRPYATSLALGFFSFGIGMLLLAGLGTGWLHPSDQHAVGVILAAFGGKPLIAVILPRRRSAARWRASTNGRAPPGRGPRPGGSPS